MYCISGGGDHLYHPSGDYWRICGYCTWHRQCAESQFPGCGREGDRDSNDSLHDRLCFFNNAFLL